MVRQAQELLRPQLKSSTDLEELRQKALKKKSAGKAYISVCGGTGCRAAGAEAIVEAFTNEILRREIQLEVQLKETGCHGFCERGPVVVIHPRRVFYQHVQPEDVSEIISKTLLQGIIIERLLYTDAATGEKITYEPEVPFYKKQTRVLLAANGEIDPTDIEDYISVGGYSALNKALFRMSPQSILDEICRSGLRGRGGGGFNTGKKWTACCNAPGEMKYVICNADEGDPGAYQDRSLVEGNPHSILEGMIIGAYTTGAHRGYIYVRNEYPLAVTHARLAIEQAQDYGLLGENILGSGFDFTVSIVKGGGAFVCGESSALISSLEGQIGEPKAKYVHMAEKGLWERPTLLNNVKTWASVPQIINRGADEYASIGTAGSKGTMIFSLVGKINNTGLVEVPMGITLREMIYGIGGGIPNQKKFKAVQTGGPSGGCIPAQYLDSPVDFDELSRLGSMMGSGAMIVMDEDTCMVDIARYFVDFLKDESCGKCVPCREGLTRMSQILNNIVQGKGKPEDLETLEDLAFTLNNGALCALGTSAANPVLSTMRYFRQEYMAHIQEKNCPAGVCGNLVHYSIDPAKCQGCQMCLKACPVGAIKGEKKSAHLVDPAACIKCGACYEVCKFSAVVKQ
jgi:NADH-quinone oxidoreductase subunit F